MKYLKKFNESSSQLEQIEAYLKDTYTSEWFDSELSNNVYNYIGEEEAEDYDGDYEEAYKNLSTGGAIEYDLIAEITKDIEEKISINASDKLDDKRDLNDVVHDHLMDTCTWKDNFIFNRKSTEPYVSQFDRMFGGSTLGNLDDFKF
jgi:hypothetical protein